ncbi:hypothetical [Prochlorococcus marinus subsp. pastoris str. CCMP1986]|uniref:Lipoprotein n=1 Tax=Prochlorococcus marinus subsp. pastoris (strain CCMP1986 / NIES-2087 / MED4) TaxID=59919 RepID=Q7V2N6_PROMP|nr:hypothetical protein [Prochlorococcus marinus]KGF86213.1 hypothetical protein PROCH_1719 [Prochlorococcus marinus str. EQPAC1]CAE18896.1 hypothetical [Prochlorococcus marinus subsp. pastoris str. CCMP1986]
MGFIKNKLFIFIILILLQSCSGGRIGNFFESSFKNIEETKIKEDVKNNLKNKIVIKSGGIVEKNKNIEETKIKEDVKNNLKNKIVIKSGGIVEKNKNIEETKIKEDVKNNLKNKVLKMSEKKSKNNKKISDKNISPKKIIFQPKSYKIIFILKDVDPKDPTEDLRAILRNSDVNFEIEKIERYFDTKNKTIKSN